MSKRILSFTLIVLFTITMLTPVIAISSEQLAEQPIDEPVVITIYIFGIGLIDIPIDFMTWSELKLKYPGEHKND